MQICRIRINYIYMCVHFKRPLWCCYLHPICLLIASILWRILVGVKRARVCLQKTTHTQTKNHFYTRGLTPFSIFFILIDQLPLHCVSLEYMCGAGRKNLIMSASLDAFMCACVRFFCRKLPVPKQGHWLLFRDFCGGYQDQKFWLNWRPFETNCMAAVWKYW